MSGEATQKLGKYSLVRKIAQGGMAEIFLANQEGPSGFQKQLVIKRILPHLADDKKFVEMFLDEARIAARFNNPNIVQIYELGEIDGAYFIAMEYIDGYDLAEIIARAQSFGKRVPSQIAARVIADSLGGLHYAHSFKDPTTGERLNLVHRDISPQNLLVNKDGVVKLVDFGVAKAKTSSSKTQTGAVKGKFSYMAPEQIAGEELDGRCDIFAMGIVLYELLLGVRPFGEHSDLMAITAIVHQAPKNPRELDESFPAELEQILNKALAKPRAERYASALDMQRDLEVFIQRSGAFITAREVATYLEGLFSDSPPDLDAIGLGASSTHSYSIAELQRSAGQGLPKVSAHAETAVAVPMPEQRKDTPPPIVPSVRPETSNPSFDGLDTPPKKSNGALIAVIAVLLLAVIGGGGFLIYTFTSGDGDGGGSGRSASAATNQSDDPTRGGVTEPDGPDASQLDSGKDSTAQSAIAKDPSNNGSGSTTVDPNTTANNDPNTGNDPNTDPDTNNTDNTDNTNNTDNTDNTNTTATDNTDNTDPPNTDPESENKVEGEPVTVAVTKVDISHIEPEKLPGVKTNLAAGFGEIRLKSNLKAQVLVDGKKVPGKLPATLSLKAGEYDVTFVSLEKNFSARKTVSVTVFDGRQYEVEVPFEKGKLNLTTDPAEGFTVTIDGTKVGKTPLKTIELFEGVHTVELDGHGKRRKYSITVLPGDNDRSIRVR